ncbi:hypothetical protein [Bacteroides sp.]|uniref:lipopolysaccharide biosynthesis protein n=1 Tax=Bacteroides sp. TaxID=29523 RepID=UPI002A8201A3|nr:hypothetical protein [Bacteroides sp.]
MRDSSKLIIKNSAFLYFRMVIVMAVGFFTSRVVLQTLGEVDFGLYNVVGGVVAFLSFLTSTMSAASARFITFALGKGDEVETRRVYRVTFTIHALASFVILILLETVGLWLFYQLNIPDDRTTICMWLYQFSVVQTFFGFATVPFGASVVAHERMNFYAYMSIYDVVVKLLVLYVLVYLPYDKLMSYGTLCFLVSISGMAINVVYCYCNFKEISIKPLFSKDILIPITRFSGWSMVASLSYMLSSQGVAYLINIYCGAAVNAAQAIGNQVRNIIGRFTSGFNTALNPQITKSYAQGDYEYMNLLINNASRYNFLVLFVGSMPVYLILPELLELWLGTVPQYTVQFAQVLIIGSILDGMISPLMVAINATAKLKWTQLAQTLCLFLAFAGQWLLLKEGLEPEWVYIWYYICLFFAYISRVLILRDYINMSITRYFREIIGTMVVVSTVSILTYVAICHLYQLNIIANIIIGFVCAAIPVWFIGLKKNERALVLKAVRRVILKK